MNDFPECYTLRLPGITHWAIVVGTPGAMGIAIDGNVYLSELSAAGWPDSASYGEGMGRYLDTAILAVIDQVLAIKEDNLDEHTAMIVAGNIGSIAPYTDARPILQEMRTNIIAWRVRYRSTLHTSGMVPRPTQSVKQRNEAFLAEFPAAKHRMIPPLMEARADGSDAQHYIEWCQTLYDQGRNVYVPTVDEVMRDLFRKDPVPA